MKYRIREIGAFALLLALMASMVPGTGVRSGFRAEAKTAKKSADCKTLCGAALKAAGGSGKLKYTSESAMDFGALTPSARGKVKSIQYICDDKEAYSLCVMEAKNASGAKSLLKTIQKYKKSNCSSNYLSDYSDSERKVFQNAVCGKKKNFVWYIALSPKKKDNNKGQSAIKKKL